MAAKKGDGKTVVVKFKFKRSTKGTHVYEEVDDKGEPARNVIGSLYVQRAAMANAQIGGMGEPPQDIEATFKFA